MNQAIPKFSLHRLCVAPMMDLTDRHCRYFLRQLSQHTLLYTEMVVDISILHAKREKRLDKLLAFSSQELPLIVQLGGSDPQKLAEASRICADYGYSGINLNVGCPSDRVQSGRFGACLMKEPDLTSRCMEAIQQAVDLPVSIKHRIGVDDQDSFENLRDFIKTVHSRGTKTFIIHARKAFLKGLSPAENRHIPPLKHDWVLCLKKEFPQLEIILNGGIRDLETSLHFLETLDGVMIGRAAYEDPYLLAEADTKIFGASKNPCATRAEVLSRLFEYAHELEIKDIRQHALIRHLMGLVKGQKGARLYRSSLSLACQKEPKKATALIQAEAMLRQLNL